MTAAPRSSERSLVMNAYQRVRRNFWVLVAAAAVAVGVLSVAATMAPGPVAGALTAVSASFAVAAVALAGRILVVTGRRREPPAPHRRPRRLGHD